MEFEVNAFTEQMVGEFSEVFYAFGKDFFSEIAERLSCWPETASPRICEDIDLFCVGHFGVFYTFIEVFGIFGFENELALVGVHFLPFCDPVFCSFVCPFAFYLWMRHSFICPYPKEYVVFGVGVFGVVESEGAERI